MSRTRTTAALACLAFLAGCGEPTSPKPKDAVHELELPGPLSESPEAGLFSGGMITHHELVDRLHELADDSHARGLLLQVSGLGGAYARTGDLRRALARLREAKKPVHCYFEGTDNLGYALMANSCDRISMLPTGLLNLVGVAAEAIYARELLASVGLRADLMQVGKYKGAADPFTADQMPPEVRENLNAMLDDLQATLVSLIAEGRGLTPERVQELIDGGPYTAHDAQAAGLIDDVGFDDEAREHARTAADVRPVVQIELRPKREDVGLADLLEALTGGSDERKASGKRIVLAHLDGTIMRGNDNSVQSAHAVPFVAAMREFADDDDVRAVVLRIDSPGGSASASDMMWQAVRRVAGRKPVIVSVGDMAASGGYWVASAGTEIVADDRSLLGSIGVVGGKIVAEELGERAGVEVTHLTRGKHAAWMSAMRGFSDDERQAFERSLNHTYGQFIRRISAGRDMTAEQIDPVAQGRIMTGARAREGGLVDLEGGLREALALAREKAQLPDDVDVQVWPKQPTLLEQIAELTGGAEARAGLLSQVLQLGRVESAAGVLETLILGDDSHIAALPFVLRLH